MNVQRISVNEVNARLVAGHEILFVDTRSPKDWERSDVKLPLAIRLPADLVPDHLDELPHEGTIVTYCG